MRVVLGSGGVWLMWSGVWVLSDGYKWRLGGVLGGLVVSDWWFRHIFMSGHLVPPRAYKNQEPQDL